MEPLDDWMRGPKPDPEYIPRKHTERADKPPRGYHYDPYSGGWRKNLTEAEVQNLWPYKKETPNVTDKVVSTKKQWRQEDSEALRMVNPIKFDCEEKGELHSPPAVDRSGPMPPLADMELPIRMLGPKDTSEPAVLLGQGARRFVVSGEKAKEMAVVMAQVNEFQAQGLLKPADNVVLPKHYARFKIEPIRFICENGLNFFQGNVIKYVLRYDAKNGLEDLKKARRYLNMFILYVEGDADWWKAE